MRLRLRTLQESQVERHEHQDDSDVYHEPLPESVPEEQDVHADHYSYQGEHIKHRGCLSPHRFFSSTFGRTVVGDATTQCGDLTDVTANDRGRLLGTPQF